MIKKSALALACALGTVTPAFASSIQVDEAWAAMMEGESDRGDMFLHITNNGATADRLYAIKLKIAGSAKLEAMGEDDVLSGGHQEVTALEVPAGQSVAFSEDGPHIELFDLAAPLENGDSFAVTLFFENAGPVRVDVVVREEGEGH